MPQQKQFPSSLHQQRRRRGTPGCSGRRPPPPSRARARWRRAAWPRPGAVRCAGLAAGLSVVSLVRGSYIFAGAGAGSSPPRTVHAEWPGSHFVAKTGGWSGSPAGVVGGVSTSNSRPRRRRVPDVWTQKMMLASRWKLRSYKQDFLSRGNPPILARPWT